MKVGYGARTAPRETYTTLRLNIDPHAAPFLERLNLKLTIDHDYVVHVEDIRLDGKIELTAKFIILSSRFRSQRPARVRPTFSKAKEIIRTLTRAHHTKLALSSFDQM
ncbi:MAG: hypothetical protein IPG62_00580 [Sphingomonadales bacterium]|nr:hypothetical protein [Sphingomonadales bacterium]